MKTADGREVVFAFVGAGSVMDKLVMYTKKHHFENIIFIPYQDKADLVYSLNAGDVHWCVNAKGIKGVSVPSKAYGIMAAGKPILGVLEKGTEARCLIEDTNCGKCCEPGDYVEVADLIRWYVENADSDEVKQMGQNGREYLVENLTKDVSVKKYINEIKKC
jgi:glycosyltransferase involved in cell wall biosynthesis